LFTSLLERGRQKAFKVIVEGGVWPPGDTKLAARRAQASPAHQPFKKQHIFYIY